MTGSGPQLAGEATVLVLRPTPMHTLALELARLDENRLKRISRRVEQSPGNSGCGTPSGRIFGAATASRRRSAQRPSGAYGGLDGVDLASAACCDWRGVARPSRCRLGATPRPGDRCPRRGHRSISPAWLRSCRSRSTVAPGGLRDGWPHACLPMAAIHGDQQSP